MTLTYTLFGLSLIIAVAYLVTITVANARTTRRLNAAEQRLNALRSNCSIRNERGQMLRYVNASPEVRARAESTERTA